MKKINFCKATTIILIINVILSIVLFFVVPDNIAIQWVGTTPSNAVDSYYIFLVPILSVLFAFPFIPLLIYGVCLIITPIIISAICLKIQCRNSLVERIKMAD